MFTSFAAVMVAGIEVSGWLTRHKAPNPAALLFPTIALGLWRTVHLVGFDDVMRHLRSVRMAMLAAIALLATFGVYQWGWRGAAAWIPLAAAWNIALELRQKSESRQGSTVAG